MPDANDTEGPTGLQLDLPAPESVIASVGLGLAAFGTNPLSNAARRTLAELVRHQQFVVKAMAVGLDKRDAEQLLVEWPDDDAEFILKAHIMGVERDTAVQILANAPQGWADWALEQAAINQYRNPQEDRYRQDVTDWAFGPGYTADYIAITAERNRQEAIACGRHREGDRSTWYARITWSQSAWDTLHPPKRTR